MHEMQLTILGNELDSDGWALIAPYGEHPKSRTARVKGVATEQKFLQVLDNASADKLLDKESGLFRTLRRAIVGIPVYLGHPDLAEHSRRDRRGKRREVPIRLVARAAQWRNQERRDGLPSVQTTFGRTYRPPQHLRR